MTTAYTYDALDDLLTMNQSGLLRTFTYDGINRLTQAINPESGTLNYSYDANGNLITRQDARFTTTLAFDKLNRLIRKSYTDPNTPAVNLCYDGATSGTGLRLPG